MGFEPTPFRNSALSYRLRPLGHIVIDRTNVAKVLFLAFINRPIRHRVGSAVLVCGWRETSSDATGAETKVGEIACGLGVTCIALHHPRHG